MSPLAYNKITLRGILYYGGLLIVVCVLVGYALFQARFLIAGPQITLLNPPGTIQTQRMIHIEGIVKNIVNMTLNGRQIYTDENGYFKEALVLENGYTIATLQAHDRYGRSRSYTQEFVYRNPVNE
ncbi:MAG: hypothetical protein ACI92I_000814 [Acidimicrobiales bacterium]|jgi:hypothetical protein